MNYSTSCKFCKRPITVEVDDDYAKLGDPYKILPLACCNHCGDVRVMKRNLEDQLKAQCYSIQLLKSAKVPIPDKAKSNLELLTKEYATMVSKWNFSEGMLWDEGIVDALCANPQGWGNIIGRIWRIHKNWQQQHSQQML